ncbi:hypothetical protein HXX76_015851 [Chlamydomonas incerta]|uniref:Kazal-like domain-containing protein n=1 Tax=Chlamydomonas incerta TaxID=51695 RepID=A0A835SDF5_CHLIN|nr:hypothetical protein HXX76_015851 [Chlamydomonas incerta]|eukprot:KAG2422687.1 hypothetical protein HXX76_015851 [Chlamydomonas incerta]
MGHPAGPPLQRRSGSTTPRPLARPALLRSRAADSRRRAPATAAASTLSRARAVAAAALVLGLSSFAALSWAQQQPQFDLGAAVPQGDSTYRAGNGGLGIGATLMRLPLLGGSLGSSSGGGGLGGGGSSGSLGGSAAGSRSGVGLNTLVSGGGASAAGATVGGGGGASTAAGGSLTSWAGVEGAVEQMRQDASLAADSAIGRAAQLANSTAAALMRLRQDGASALVPGGAPAAGAAGRLAESAGRGERAGMQRLLSLVQLPAATWVGGGSAGGSPRRIQWQWSQDQCGNCPAEAQPVCCRQRVTYRNACKAIACHNEVPASCVQGRCDNSTASGAGVAAAAAAPPNKNAVDDAAPPPPAGSSANATTPSTPSSIFTSSTNISTSVAPSIPAQVSDDDVGSSPPPAPAAAANPADAARGGTLVAASGDSTVQSPTPGSSSSVYSANPASNAALAAPTTPSNASTGAVGPSPSDQDASGPYTYSSDPSGVCGCVGELAAGGPLCCGGRAYSNPCAAQCLGEQLTQCTPGWCAAAAGRAVVLQQSADAVLQPARGVFRPLVPAVVSGALPSFAAAAGGGGGPAPPPAASSTSQAPVAGDDTAATTPAAATAAIAAPAPIPNSAAAVSDSEEPQRQPAAVLAPGAPPQSCDCVPLWAPVCCGGKAYMNGCSARCAGGVKDVGTCVAGVVCSAAAHPADAAEGADGSAAGAEVAVAPAGAGAGAELLPIVTVTRSAEPGTDVQQKR